MLRNKDAGNESLFAFRVGEDSGLKPQQRFSPTGKANSDDDPLSPQVTEILRAPGYLVVSLTYGRFIWSWTKRKPRPPVESRR